MSIRRTSAYIREFVLWLRCYSQSNEQQHSERSEADVEYSNGKALAVYEALDTLRNQATAFRLSDDRVGFVNSATMDDSVDGLNAFDSEEVHEGEYPMEYIRDVVYLLRERADEATRDASGGGAFEKGRERGFRELLGWMQLQAEAFGIERDSVLLGEFNAMMGPIAPPSSEG